MLDARAHERARRLSRARVGLWLGPGSILILSVFGAAARALGLVTVSEHGDVMDGAWLFGLATVLIMFLHICSFFELMASMALWSERPPPLPVCLLGFYWLLAVAWAGSKMVLAG